MLTEGLVFANESLLADIRGDESLRQVSNVAHLPGIVGRSIAMPDVHWGYGFPIGGVAAFDGEDGIVSPGGVGYDINCGVRCLSSGLPAGEIRGRARELAEALFRTIPSGVGSSRRDLRLDRGELRRVLRDGAAWAVARGFGEREDLDLLEEGGRLEGADPSAVSDRALERGRSQVGTVGSGNHFVEVQEVEEVYHPRAAELMGLRRGRVAVTIHSGSRGLGYQVCDDSLKTMLRAAGRYGITLPDRQLCCAPLRSEEGRRYLEAMAAAANFAFANRQMMAHDVRETFERSLGLAPREHGLRTVYDVCHNVAKMETHELPGGPARVCVHRKGATRAFPPGHEAVPERYREIGQPVLIPGDMGRYSYVLVGAPGAMAESFGSTCHGAGRVMSRSRAVRANAGRPVVRELENRGIVVRSAGRRTLLEEVPEAYKDVREVVEVVAGAGLARKVARLRPMIVVKG
jgi:tRNA-splicing ligase RtcB